MAKDKEGGRNFVMKRTRSRAVFLPCGSTWHLPTRHDAPRWDYLQPVNRHLVDVTSERQKSRRPGHDMIRLSYAILRCSFWSERQACGLECNGHRHFASELWVAIAPSYSCRRIGVSPLCDVQIVFSPPLMLSSTCNRQMWLLNRVLGEEILQLGCLNFGVANFCCN